VAKGLTAVPGVEVFPSQANFILFRTTHPSDEVCDGLLGKGVLVRNLGSAPGLLRCLRVTVGTREENDRFLEGLTHVMKTLGTKTGIG
jgi:histidinol-phosphate aminotransferase